MKSKHSFHLGSLLRYGTSIFKIVYCVGHQHVITSPIQLHWWHTNIKCSESAIIRMNLSNYRLFFIFLIFFVDFDDFLCQQSIYSTIQKSENILLLYIRNQISWFRFRFRFHWFKWPNERKIIINNSRFLLLCPLANHGMCSLRCQSDGFGFIRSHSH